MPTKRWLFTLVGSWVAVPAAAQQLQGDARVSLAGWGGAAGALGRAGAPQRQQKGWGHRQPCAASPWPPALALSLQPGMGAAAGGTAGILAMAGMQELRACPGHGFREFLGSSQCLGLLVIVQIPLFGLVGESSGSGALQSSGSWAFGVAFKAKLKGNSGHWLLQVLLFLPVMAKSATGTN